MSGVIREEEWLKELERLSHRNGDGSTAEEWAAKLDKSVTLVRKLLGKALAMGRLARDTRTITRLDGKPTSVPVYRVLSTSGASATTTKSAASATGSRRRAIRRSR